MPATVSYPGVYIQELPSSVHTITGVATSIAAFVGYASQGPTTPQLVLSWADYARTYGGLVSGLPLGYAVSQFFGNGGSQAYIIRLTDSGAAAPTSAAATLTLSAAPASGGSAAGGAAAGGGAAGGGAAAGGAAAAALRGGNWRRRCSRRRWCCRWRHSGWRRRGRWCSGGRNRG